MKASFVSILVVVLAIFYADAFLPVSHPRAARFKSSLSSVDQPNDNQSESQTSSSLTHNDILWKLRPPPETSLIRKCVLRLAANSIRLESFVKRVDPPFVLCPKGGQAVLEAYYQAPGTKRHEKIARFGITTVRGPPAVPISETVEDLYRIDLKGRLVGTAAIIYMFVEPNYRKRGVAALALQVISAIHALQGIDFTILVADDNGSGKLVKWYEQHGFTRAPKLQDMLGSPNGEYGVTMMAPTRNRIDPACRVQWW